MLRQTFLGLLIWLGLGTAALAEKRVALVLAASDYDFIRPLSNPENDARAMQDLLEKLDFEVYVETNRDLRRMRRALEDFQADAAGADVALLYFAGHGVALDGVNFLLPTDSQASSSEKLTATALPLAEAQAALQTVAPVVIVILDACRDDPFAGGDGEGRSAAALADDPAVTSPSVDVTPGLGRIGRADGVLFAFAAAPNETASDGEGANSPFTAALVRHFGTAGVELRTALTLVQQDVYDRSRGKQLPYIESGLPELVFITGEGVLPERDQLLIAMADLTPDIRAEIESLAADRDMPLAPLYAALLSGDLANQGPADRARLLLEAAQSYEAFQTELQRFQSDDPRVADLRARADEQLSLGAFDTARALLTEAAEIDSAARTTIRETYLSRTVSEAATHLLNANAARTDLRYDLAIQDLGKAVALYAEIEDEDIDRETRFTYVGALASLGDLHLVAGNTQAALAAFMQRSKFAQTQAEANPMDVGWVRELVWSLNSVGSVLQQQGYLDLAETAFASALEFSQWQADQMPDDVDLMRDRQMSRNKLGEVRFARNDFPGALAAHGEALSINETLLAADPASVTYRRDLAYTRERLGDVYLALGDRKAAEAAYAFSLGITEALVAEYPGDEGMIRDLSVSYERNGDTLVANRDFAGALESYGKALAIREELAALDPDNTLRQRDLSVTFERIGDTNNLLGDRESALLAQQAAAAIRQKLAALDPTNMQWQRDLTVSYERLGDLFFAQNDFVAALGQQELARTIREGIVALEPQILPRQRDLGVTLEKIAAIKLAMGDQAGGEATYVEVQALRQSLVTADPAVAQYRLDLAYSLGQVSNLFVGQGRHAEAEPLQAQVVQLRTDLVGASPEDLPALRDLSIAQNLWSSTLLSLGRSDEALAAGRLSLATVDRLLQIAPDTAEHVHDRLVTLNRLGDAQTALADHGSAVESFREMVAAGSRLLEIDPFSAAFANDLSIGLERLADAQLAAGDQAGSLKSHQDCLALRDWLVQQDSSNPAWYRNLAVSHERVSAALARQGDMSAALEEQDQSLSLMRNLAAAYPDDPFYRIDVVRALDLKAALVQDPIPENQEALAILEDMQAQGTLPPDYVQWIPAFRRVLGLPQDF